jgi:hypothetical protein
MKAISNNKLEQVSGGYGDCLVAIKDIATNTSHCIMKISGDIPVFELPMAYALPVLITMTACKMAYDIYLGNHNKTVITPITPFETVQLGN